MATEFAGEGLPMSADGMTNGCDRLGVQAAEIWAVLTVETMGSGFLPDRRPQILFERHIFRRETDGAFDATAPEVSNPAAGGYGALGAHQYDRLEQAIPLDRQAALHSTSWGIGQVMGFNAGIAGFPDAETMVLAMMKSEDEQVRGMFEFLMANRLDGPLRSHDWTSFARAYNGPAFAKNQYDARLAAAFQKFSTGLLPDLTIREAQIYLKYVGFDPGPVDGTLGRMTRSAVMQFQDSRGLPETGDLDDVTLGELHERAASTESGALSAGASG